MQRKLTQAVQFICVTMVLSACVTINIYFPAAAAEKAADKIIEEVWQLEREQNEENQEKEE